jgi:hypothetical protein
MLHTTENSQDQTPGMFTAAFKFLEDMIVSTKHMPVHIQISEAEAAAHDTALAQLNLVAGALHPSCDHGFGDVLNKGAVGVLCLGGVPVILQGQENGSITHVNELATYLIALQPLNRSGTQDIS